MGMCSKNNFNENGIRGGITRVTRVIRHYAEANNKYMPLKLR